MKLGVSGSYYLKPSYFIMWIICQIMGLGYTIFTFLFFLFFYFLINCFNLFIFKFSFLAAYFWIYFWIYFLEKNIYPLNIRFYLQNLFNNVHLISLFCIIIILIIFQSFLKTLCFSTLFDVFFNCIFFRRILYDMRTLVA